jgi:adenosylhomocysteine nucleosidase
MPEEVEGFLQGATSRTAHGKDFTLVRLGPFEAVVAGCGLGKVNAAMTASILIERWQCRGLVSAGTAGGLTGIEPMQVIIGHELVQHDYGRSRGPGELELYRPGDPPLPEYRRESVALRLPEVQLSQYRAITSALEHVRYGRYASGDTFVNDPSTRQRLIALGAVACDMESAAVAQVAEYHDVPWLVAKGISDEASAQSHEDFLEGLAEASRLSAEVVAALLPAMLGGSSDPASDAKSDAKSDGNEGSGEGSAGE